MIEMREMGWLCMHAASNVVGTIADHNLRIMRLSIANARRSFECAAQLAAAKTGAEVMELSSAYWRVQLNVLRGCFDNRLDLACKMTTDATGPFRSRAIAPTRVIL